jgi:hypothetical protein
MATDKATKTTKTTNKVKDPKPVEVPIEAIEVKKVGWVKPSLPQ